MSNWKDTVIKKFSKVVAKVWDKHDDYADAQFWQSIYTAVAEAQAEVSFKAGIKEVVEWIEKLSYINRGQGKPFESERCFEEFKWQAKLKSWGISA